MQVKTEDGHFAAAGTGCEKHLCACEEYKGVVLMN